MPGFIAHIADDRLDQQAGNGSGNPEDGDLFNGSAEDLENTADIGILQGESKLDAKKAKTQIPYLPKTELRFAIHSGFWVIRGLSARA